MEGKTIEIILYTITIVLSVCSGIYITIGKERYKDEKTVFSKLIPLLIITFVVDIKERIIPNRITMLLFQTGIFFTMLHCIDLTSPVTNLIYLRESIIGLLTAVGIFGVMALLRRNNCR